MPVLGGGWLGGLAVTASFRTLFGGQLARQFVFQRPGETLGHQKGLLHTGISSANKFRHKQLTKPPNILLYTGKDDVGDKKCSHLRACLQRILDKDSYALYRLKEEQVLSQPWPDNTALLVVAACSDISISTSQIFLSYLKQGGRVLSLCSGFHAELEKIFSSDSKELSIVSVETTAEVFDRVVLVDLICEPYFYKLTDSGKESTRVLMRRRDSGEAVVVQVAMGMGTAVLSMVRVEEEAGPNGEQTREADGLRQQLLTTIVKELGVTCSPTEDAQLTPAHLFATPMDQAQLMASLQPVLKEGICKGSELSLQFVTEKETLPQASRDILPIIINGSATPSGTVAFYWQRYQTHLRTKVLGKILLYSEVITSTQAVFDGNHSFTGRIPKSAGVVVVAGRQVKGKGRGGNTWLSPIGCLMFSLQVRVRIDTELGSRLPYLQHIASLAVVEAVRSLPGYEEINICLKWPNDIYLGRSVKIGGVIVTSSASDGCFSAVIGMGINLSNSKPTGCINDAIQRYNQEHGADLQPLLNEVLLARTVNCIESLIEDFQRNGPDSFQEKYYKRWLHSNSQVCLNTSGSPEMVTIVGLDDFGFLSVQRASGETCSLQPDGNSFDMLKNLITTKQT